METSIFERQIDSWGLGLDRVQIASLRSFGYMLHSYSEANVIGAKSYSAVMEDHVLDSLSCLLFQGFEGCNRLIDVGAGAGLPGIPLKIARPDLSLTLLEATSKKVRFAEKSIEELNLSDAVVVSGRAEEIGRRGRHRGGYDIATARALAPLSVVAEYCLPLVRVGGSVVAMKGNISPEEIDAGKAAARMLGARVSEVLRVPLLPQLRAKDRCLVVLEKTSRTPGRYPRRTGIPKKQPLGSELARN